jgi:hypothetical protein
VRGYELLAEISRRLAEVSSKLDRVVSLLEGLAGVPAVAPAATPTAPVTTVEEAPCNRYRVFKLDLSVSRDNEPLGLRDLGIVARSAVVTRLDSAAYWRRNDPVTGDVEELYTGYRVSNFEIEELYITNPAGSGFLTIVVEWRE